MRKLVRVKDESYLVFEVGFCDFLGGYVIHFWKVFEVWFFQILGPRFSLFLKPNE